MGGRRSRYWCGPGFFRETKKAPVRGFIGQWSAPAFFVAPAASAAGVHRKSKKGIEERRGKDEGRNDIQTITPDHLHKRARPGARKCQTVFGKGDSGTWPAFRPATVALRLREPGRVAFIGAFPHLSGRARGPLVTAGRNGLFLRSRVTI